MILLKLEGLGVQTMLPDNMKDWVLLYYNKGFSVIPLKEHDKTPESAIKTVMKNMTFFSKEIRKIRAILEMIRDERGGNDDY